jgi:hypothetical protein
MSEECLKLLVLSDVGIESVNALAEQLIQNPLDIDIIVCCGPFCNSIDWTKNKENCAISIGDMATIIATLEQIQCRVIYLPIDTDPMATLFTESHLTPNSINIHGRKMNLLSNLFISGFAETQESLLENDNINNRDDDALEGVELKSSNNTVQVIEDLISATSNDAVNIIPQQGIFVLNYLFTHTLNHFLFHMPERLETNSISICIVSTNQEKLKLPSSLGPLTILTTHRLKTEKKYAIIDLKSINGNWVVLECCL